MKRRFNCWPLVRSGSAALGLMFALLAQPVIAAEDADEETLPLDELRVFAEVFGRIKE